MELTDEQAREMMFGDNEFEDELEESGDLIDENNEKDSKELQDKDTKIEDIDFENDEEIKELKKQSPKLDSAFAKLRREKEVIQKEKEAIDSRLKQFDGFVQEKYKTEYGLENTDQFINYMLNQKTEEQNEAYETMKNDLAETHGVDPKIIDSLIQNNPDFIKFKELAQKFETKEQLDVLEKNYESSFKELQGEYKQFKSIEDINTLLGDKSPKFWELFKDKNLSMLEAYELADRDNLKNKTKRETEQKTLNKVNGKAHLKPTKLNAEVDYTDVDSEELAWYEGLMGSKWTHQQMIEHSKSNRR